MLVGIGPGSTDHMTARARAAIAEADTIIGYVTYIKLVADLIEGKEIIRKSMTEELDRAIESLARAREGKKVALISSGDAGVYGMAGPTFEVLFQAGWTPPAFDENGVVEPGGIEVEIVPGASALNSCAARVGAPLTHDFCAISLSDLLTPWPTIARRLDAAAMADFVVALYNPKSGRRTRQIEEAQRLFFNITRVSAHVVNGEPIAVVQEAGSPHWWNRPTPLPANIVCLADWSGVDPERFKAVLWITHDEVTPERWAAWHERLVVYRPPVEGAAA